MFCAVQTAWRSEKNSNRQYPFELATADVSVTYRTPESSEIFVTARSPSRHAKQHGLYVYRSDMSLTPANHLLRP
jgi:hypothetical protein